MALNASQTFFVDKEAVQHATHVNITAIDLYFQSKPNEVNNRSGIVAPGVVVQLVGTANGVPILDDIASAPYARVDYGSIRTSVDASTKTQFRFDSPVSVITGREYAVVIGFDGDEDFVLWTSKKGDYLVGTTQKSPGPSSDHVGNYYTKAMAPPTHASNAVSTSLMASSSESVLSYAPNSAYASVHWRPLVDTDLKFRVHSARFCFDGSTTFPANTKTFTPSGGGIVRTDGIWEYRVPATPMEYVLFDRKSSRVGTIHPGELVYQNTVYYSHTKDGNATTVATVNGSMIVTAQAGMNFNDIFIGDEWIVITSENHSGAGLDAVAVRQVKTIAANNRIQLYSPIPFTNSSAKFFVSPVATIDSVDKIQRFGAVKDILVLRNSNANSSVRFVNNVITSLTVNAAGTGYDNTDVLTISGFENVASAVAGGYVAVGNVVTNPSGNIISIALSNVGAGFVNVAELSYSVVNSTAGAVSGGATFYAEVGAVLKAELLGTDGAGGRFSNCEIINLGFGAVTPEITVSNPPGTVYTAHHRFGYYETSSALTYSGKAYYAYPDASVTESPLIDGTRRKIIANDPPIMPSRSNEYVIMYPNGSVSQATSNSINQLPVDVGGSNSSVVIIRAASNNDFSHVTASTYKTRLTFSEYIYNNDYTGENTDQGNAWAKEITSKVNLVGNGAYAEDLVVYVTAHRPVNTDIQVFARIHNSTDGESFEDKDWTRLEYKGSALHSNPTNEDDMHEFTFGFQAAPNTGVTLAGTATTTLSQANVIGSNTTFNTDLAAGDLVKVYQPLFANNYMISPVASVTNATHLVLADPVANAGIVGSGLKVDKIGYPHQAFSNKLNQNVVRYYTSSMAAVDGYDSMQFKIVLLSANTLIYPVVDDIRTVAVSA